ncbi:hypothetical protein IHE55_08860 [Streptomyces pactum]|uniref:DUF4342 domain-containing protein n=1 Tax=Streptomyces pactum TaxID=68249 RepID=A0ABS0NI79_9ACTN|nr:hypothetical protein [Streptomyces pactum]MBH5334895.1 hypothetical protein [Streptomyces pactum]
MDHTSAHEIRVELEGAADSDQEELEALTLELRQHLLEFEVERAELARRTVAPDGTKVAGALTVGAIIVTAGASLLPKLLNVIKAWIENRPVRTATVTIGEDSIEMEALSSKDQRRLIDAFIASHESSSQDGTSA